MIRFIPQKDNLLSVEWNGMKQNWMKKDYFGRGFYNNQSKKCWWWLELK